VLGGGDPANLSKTEFALPFSPRLGKNALTTRVQPTTDGARSSRELGVSLQSIERKKAEGRRPAERVGIFVLRIVCRGREKGT